MHGTNSQPPFGSIFSPLRAPKAVENFSTHSRNGYYNGHLVHRVIKGFMLQTGDPGGIPASKPSRWRGGGDAYVILRIRAGIVHETPSVRVV